MPLRMNGEVIHDAGRNIKVIRHKFYVAGRSRVDLCGYITPDGGICDRETSTHPFAAGGLAVLDTVYDVSYATGVSLPAMIATAAKVAARESQS